MPDLYLLAGLTFLVAALYSSVGHGGASGYLAVMALVGVSPAITKPTALVLNLLVAGVGCLRYIYSGCFRWSSFWPFALGSIPLAFLGGSMTIPDALYGRVLGVVLVVAAVGLVIRKTADSSRELRPLPVWAGILGGLAIGFVSGLIGVGGGIFLSPILIFAAWATTRETLGIASLFILVNSAAGLLGNVSRLHGLPQETAWLAFAAFFGGLVGSELGSQRLKSAVVRQLLAVVLVTASLKLLIGH